MGFINGLIKIYRCDNGVQVCELAAHSRTITGLICHPTKSVFATTGDDTMMNVWELTGNKLETMDLNLMLSSRVNDFQLTGIAWGKESHNSIVASVYDFKTILVWDDIL